MNQKSNNGFALITLLIFIALLTPIMISMTSLIAMERHTSQNYAAYYRHILLTDLAQAKIQEEDLKVSETWQPIEMPELKTYESLQYKIHFLQTIPCFQIKNSLKPGADFFKLMIQSKNHHETIQTESTFVKPAKTSVTCAGSLKIIDSGFLSWKVLEK